MAPRGPKPKPEALKKLQGNPGKRRVVKTADDAAKDPRGLVAPKSLSAAEKKIWNEMTGALRQLNFVRESDLRALTRFVKFQALFDAVAPMVTAKNLVEVTVSEKVTMQRVSKHFLAMVHIDKRLEAYDERFGTNPAARQSLMSRLASNAPQLPLADQTKPAETTSEAPPPATELPASPIGFGRMMN